MEKPEVRLPLPEAASDSDRERNLDVACARVLSGPEGELVLSWLRAVYVNAILGPTATDAELRYREGARSVVAALNLRAERGRNPPSEPAAPARSRRRHPYGDPDPDALADAARRGRPAR